MSEDERLIRNDPAIREIAQMVTNYCASCVELEARATAAEAREAKLLAVLKWRPSRADYETLRQYDDAVMNWERQARAAIEENQRG